VIVDEDIDPGSPEQVEWAIATRVQADRDVLVIPDQTGSSLDPSAKHRPGKKSRTAKMIVDATRKGGGHYARVVE
jgi:2,5-furandicarboxylate decarboxylase 1